MGQKVSTIVAGAGELTIEASALGLMLSVAKSAAERTEIGIPGNGKAILRNLLDDLDAALFGASPEPTTALGHLKRRADILRGDLAAIDADIAKQEAADAPKIEDVPGHVETQPTPVSPSDVPSNG